jgi:DTW domain-containing protein YfiP
MCSTAHATHATRAELAFRAGTSEHRPLVSRRNNAALRCARCHMHSTLCVCALIPRLATRTKVVLVIHRYEDRKPTNTGRLATECLVNSEVRVRGHLSDDLAPLGTDADAQTVLLFPHEDAVPLERFVASERPVTLVVPDGNWRQASKVRKRVPGLAGVPCALLPAGAPSSYRLRAEAHGHGLAALDAIARALGILEGDHVRAAMEALFRTMVERTLWVRGSLPTSDVTGGIPVHARLRERGHPR